MIELQILKVNRFDLERFKCVNALTIEKMESSKPIVIKEIENQL